MRATMTGGPPRHRISFIASTASCLLRMRSPVAPVEQKDRERTLADVREHLDPSDFARAWAEGRAMALEDWTKVIDFALGG